jgi:ABC-type phosphate transport system permease subunit
MAAGAVAIYILCAVFLWEKLSHTLKRGISENLFFIITAGCAVMIIVFVLYMLINIFMIGKDSLTWDFLFTAPKEGLTEGGIFPAIVGTALLVIIMSIVGVPIGTITAIYLTEYAKETSKIARFIRFAVSTLAGVPAIVFGLFGLGFFIGTVGKGIDTFQTNQHIEKIEAILSADASPLKAPDGARIADVKDYLASISAVDYEDDISLMKSLEEIKGEQTPVGLQETVKYLKERRRPNWGQPALIWAALTMALLTLPVVIVSVEEAIRTVPRDLREASLALGATKFMTIIRVVIPGSITGILTGGILAVSRGAGEVAPILFTGAAFFLPDLPNSLSSQFMELGYHIWVLTTQSPNVELTRPLQYATTLVLLLLTFTLNFSAIFLRAKVRAKLAKNN